MKYGRLPAKRGVAQTLSKYTRAIALPPPPVTCKPPNIVWPMDLNNQLGDCVIAAVAHCIQRWNGAVLTNDRVLALYEQLSGYNPADPNTDRGCVETDVLTSWINGSIPENKLSAFVSLNISDLDELRDAINWFGIVYLGINCPQAAESNTVVWDVVEGSPILGGHAVILVGYDADFFYVVSWGMLIATTPAFIAKYTEEAYALLDTAWLQANNLTPSGFDLAQLQQDMDELKS
jgi:hypothetical protein